MSAGSEIRALGFDLRHAPEKANGEIKKVIARGALNIKNRMTREMRSSRHFKGVARSIDYDLHDSSAFGGRVISAEIGPNKSTHRGAALAGIAYFGGANGGGGTVPDPKQALEDEVESSYDWLVKAVSDVL